MQYIRNCKENTPYLQSVRLESASVLKPLTYWPLYIGLFILEFWILPDV
jgi:hypothetical protein